VTTKSNFAQKSGKYYEHLIGEITIKLATEFSLLRRTNSVMMVS